MRPEHGKKGWEVKIKDLETILCTQAHLYEVEKKKLPPVIVMDTNHVTTLGYAKMNGIELKVPRWITRSIKNPTYIMLEGNIPLIDDGTRYGEEGRTALAAIHKQNHTRHRGLTFSITDEGLKDRFINVLRVIEKVMYV